jgi:MFS-type transporter involved in bile tolerance (Atg22 family)
MEIDSLVNAAVIVIAVFIVGVVLGSCAEKEASRDRWCASRFAVAPTFTDSLAVVRDTLPPGCKIVIEAR